jgi:tritrans,polycis-undecaprenyl-diphosphate synthase [geranylgeranyl-diphosphate specific]
MNPAGPLINAVYRFYGKRLEKGVTDKLIPKHIAIIMDGNRRFAREQGLEPQEGHLAGKEKIKDVLDWCMKLGVTNLTVYAFSTENFNRNPDEVSFLMKLIGESLRELADDQRVHDNRVRLRAIGERDMIPEDMLEAIEYAERKTAGYGDYNFNMAIAYGGRQEIVNAVKDISSRVRSGDLNVDDIDEDTISECLYTFELPDPDLVLRTSGEFRVSNFLLWQLAYSELYFTDVYWPSFRYIDFLRAVRSYQQRARRFGT